MNADSGKGAFIVISVVFSLAAADLGPYGEEVRTTQKYSFVVNSMCLSLEVSILWLWLRLLKSFKSG